MAFISFALTWPQFESGVKIVTRRFWSPRQLAMWQRFYDDGRILHDAWTKVPFAGGEKGGQFVLAARPYTQPLGQMTEFDLLAEGGMCPDVRSFCDLIGHPPDAEPAVVWFQRVVDVRPCADCKGQFVRTAVPKYAKHDRRFQRMWHLGKDGRRDEPGCIPF